MKTCTKCKVEQPFESFHKRHNRASGYVSKCKTCIKTYAASWFEKNKEKILTTTKQAKRDWYCANKTKERARAKKYQRDNKQTISKQQREYRQENKDKFNFHAASRRALKAKATPKWLTEDHKQQIANFYSLAKELSWLSESPLEVDHIVPIKGKNVVGLHVPWNLQILPKTMNQQKGTKLI